MPAAKIAAAIRAEAAALTRALAELPATDLGRPSPCPPWTLGELACHLIVGAGRIAQAVRGPEVAGASLVTAIDYYRHDHRFSATVDADRIETACDLARRLGGPDQICAELSRACAEAAALLADAPADRAVRTRHQDPMLLAEFARTRVVELGVHGLDLAIGLDHPPWLTDQAASVIEDLMLPAGAAAELRAQLGCDRAGLIARLTGRATRTPAEAAALSSAGVVQLALR